MDISISCDTFGKKLQIKYPASSEVAIAFLDNTEQLKLPLISEKQTGSCDFDASNLQLWTPENPKLYIARVKLNNEEKDIRFGYRSINAGKDAIFLNDRPYYFRGYIRGIVAHDHPNMTGSDNDAAFRKNIMQAKKYGFNLVRFHSTVPDERFVDLADELGLFVHIEIGFSYRLNDKGEKTEKFLDEEKWRNTLKKFRNHPSVMAICIGNEMHNAGKDPKVFEFYKTGKELSPNTLILDNTGWGEYDRETTDFYAQHIAYYFPFKKHKDMFRQDFFWEKNGSVNDHDIYAEKKSGFGSTQIRRFLNPLRPYIAHEIVHYIDVPDYEALSKKFDKFAEKFGAEYLEKYEIEKPRYLTEIPALLKSKGIYDKVGEYAKGSEHFKMVCLKVYLEELRAAGNICGFEMLQLSDCLKYENKNGILDFFDDDKYIEEGWMRNINSDDVLLADIEENTLFAGDSLNIPLSISHYSPVEIRNAELAVYVSSNAEKEKIYSGSGYTIVHNGVKRLADVCINFTEGKHTGKVEVKAELKFTDKDNSENSISNEWSLWIYKKPVFNKGFELRLTNKKLENYLQKNAENSSESHLVVTDILDDKLISDLKADKTVILNYKGDGGKYYLPNVFDRFKPCIWDRGHNLGGIIYDDNLAKKMDGKYFDLNFYYPVEEGCKVNLDTFPVNVKEIISGIDKPVRDRMKGLIEGVKDFLPHQTLRNFSYLFSLKTGKGNLIVCTFNFNNPEKPACTALLNGLINGYKSLVADDEYTMPLEKLVEYLEKMAAFGRESEDVMNQFWADDELPVEDQLFWEKAGVDLSRLKNRKN